MARLFLFTTQPAPEQVVLGHPRAGQASGTTCPVITLHTVCADTSCFLTQEKLPVPQITNDNDDKVEQILHESIVGMIQLDLDQSWRVIVYIKFSQTWPLTSPAQPAHWAVVTEYPTAPPPPAPYSTVFTVLFINTTANNILQWPHCHTCL